MIDATDIKRHYNWEVAPRDAKENRWSKLYATLAQSGVIWLTRTTHEALGAPEAYLIVYDRNLHVLGLQPSRRGAKNSYPAMEAGNFGGRKILAFRILRQWSLYVHETIRFPRCFIDHSGTLILDMKDVMPCGRGNRKARY
jgi:hypothetical protein